MMAALERLVHRRVALLLLLLAIRGWADGRAQQAALSSDSIAVQEFFRDTVSLVDRTGVRRVVEVSLAQWSLTGGISVARFPQRGLFVIQLAGGDLTTVIGTRRQDRMVGEFWTVTPDSSMSAETRDDQVVLDVFAVSEQPPRRRTQR